jgi:hypothetical protein
LDAYEPPDDKRKQQPARIALCIREQTSDQVLSGENAQRG